jgi:hypothetical protein
MSDVVWTTMITGSTAVLTGCLGWLGARRQTDVELLKLRQEREDPNTAGNLKFRQEMYLRYLTRTDTLYWFPKSSSPTREGFAAVFDAFRRADDEMELFAAATVLSSRKAMWETGKKLLDCWDDTHNEPSEASEFEQWFVKMFEKTRAEIRNDWVEVRRRLVAAIREDVGPCT